MRTGAPTDQREHVTFEQRLEELEKLVEELERGDLCLEDMLKRYEHGMALVAFCQQRLERAELRITEIAAQSADQPSDA
jgi:exodeoxyribonuclease VII small subunit